MRKRIPRVSADVIIELGRGKIVLVLRKNPPHGWALPGGFVEYGESLEETARREAFEETSLRVTGLRQFHTYSDPARDPRFHSITTVYIARAKGSPKAGDDAREAGVFTEQTLPRELAFDHGVILREYFRSIRSKKHLRSGKRSQCAQKEDP